MGDKDEFLHKIMKNYNEFRLRNIDSLDAKKHTLEIKLQEEIHKSNELLDMKNRLKEEEERTNAMYYSLVEILKSRGIIFDIPNNNFKVNEWDNLHIKKLNGLYSFIDKNGIHLYTFEKKYNDTVEYIISNYSYSIIIIRIDKYSIKAQLRILK